MPAILQLTAENRALLARLEPGYWRPSANADEFHSKYLQYLVTNPDITTRVLEREDRVIGFAVSNRQPALWFIDDVCLATDADWATDGVVLLRAIEERPAAMTAPHGDTFLLLAEHPILTPQLAQLLLLLGSQAIAATTSPPAIRAGSAPPAALATARHIY